MERSEKSGVQIDLHTDENEPVKKTRKVYSPPQLIDYGPMQRLTLGFSGGGNTEDPD